MSEPFYVQHSPLYVRQQKEIAEVLIDWESRNRYEVRDEQDQPIGALAERDRGARGIAGRWFLGSHRGYDIDVVDAHGAPLLSLSRSFFWLFSELDVVAADGRRHGQVRRRFGVIYKRYDLVDGAGQVFAKIAAPRWRIWTFPVESTRGTGTATIAKKWGGVVGEVLTDADTFRVDYEHGSWSADERAVIFAAAISIDFDFFENNQGSDGLLTSFIPGAD